MSEAPPRRERWNHWILSWKFMEVERRKKWSWEVGKSKSMVRSCQICAFGQAMTAKQARRRWVGVGSGHTGWTGSSWHASKGVTGRASALICCQIETLRLYLYPSNASFHIMLDAQSCQNLCASELFLTPTDHVIFSSHPTIFSSWVCLNVLCPWATNLSACSSSCMFTVQMANQ